MLYFFLHIPKCGGSTIKQYYLSSFQKCIKVWDPRFGADCSSIQFENFEISDSECIIGHLHFLDAMKNNTFKKNLMLKNIQINTIVRDPIERMVSLYNYMNKFEKHPFHNEIKKISFEDFLLERDRNFQCKMLGIDYWGSLNEIVKNVDVIDIERSNEYFFNLFKTKFNYNLPIKEKANITAIEYGSDNLKMKKDISPQVLKILHEKNKLDFELYNIAKNVKF